MNAFLTRLREERAQLRETISTTLDAAASETRDLTEPEQVNTDQAFGRIRELDERIEHISDLELRNAAAAELAAQVDTAVGNAPETREAGGVRVTSEERVYHQRSAHSFFQDAYRSEFHHDPAASERIGRHLREEEVLTRDLTSGQFTPGLVIPQYLRDEFVPLARAGRPVANSVRRANLPASGMTLSVPKVAIGTAVGSQVNEGDEVRKQDLDDALIDVPVRTIAGQQGISRQALERGEGIDQVVFADLVAAYAVELDRQLINGSGTAGEMLGILQTPGLHQVAYVDASPSAQELYPKLADAIQRINSTAFLPATVVYVSPRRWGALTAAVDTAGRPLVPPTSQVPGNALGVGEAAQYGQVVGTVQGLPVITDANIPTLTNHATPLDQDAVIVARASDIILWEIGDGTPRELRFDQPRGTRLMVDLVAYSYAAATAARQPKSIAVVSGSGLSAPTF